MKLNQSNSSGFYSNVNVYGCFCGVVVMDTRLRKYHEAVGLNCTE